MNLNYFRNKTILITGASGYIGSNLLKRLKLKIPQTKILTPYKDIKDINFWTKYLKGVDLVYHLAAQTSLHASQSKPCQNAKTNLLPVVNFIKSCQKTNSWPDIVFTGTVTQVGLTKKIPVNESLKDNPITVYDINKLAAEKYLQYYSNQLKGRSVTLRLANVYGPGPNNRSDRGILNLFIKKALDQEKINVYGSGKYTRDYIYIDDVIDALLLSAIKINKLQGKYYLIGSGKANTINQMIKILTTLVKNIAKIPVQVSHPPFPQGYSLIETRNFAADSTAFIKKTNWQPRTSLEKGIIKTIKFYLKDQ